MTPRLQRARQIGGIVAAATTAALLVAAVGLRDGGPATGQTSPAAATETVATVLVRGGESAETYCSRILDVADRDPMCRNIDGSGDDGMKRFRVQLRAPEAAGE